MSNINTPKKKSSVVLCSPKKKSTPKKRKWDEKYLSLGFFIPQRQSSFPGDEYAQCMFCTTKYNSNGWVPSKLQRHLKSQHNDHVNKSEQFFKNYYKNNFVNSSQFFKKTFNKNIIPA